MALSLAVIALIGSTLGLTDQPPATHLTTSSRSTDMGTDTTSSDVIAPETLLSSAFSQFFQAQDYARALEELDGLVRQYPNDPLLVRYRGIVLDRLGRHHDAVVTFQQLLQRQPDHVPTHFFLAQSDDHAGDLRAARQEWRWVVEHSPVEEYRRWAQEAMDQSRMTIVQATPRQRWYLVGDIGMEYDSNPLLKPNDKGVVAPGDEQQAERFAFNLGVGYQAITRPNLRLDVVYTARQSLHTRGLDVVNFTSQELALDGKTRVTVRGRDIILGYRYDLFVGFLDGDLFSVGNQWLLGADMRLSRRTRTYVYQRVGVWNFGPDGSNPPQTSRDGFSYDLGVTQYYYTMDFRRYLFVGQEVELDQTRGANFTKRGESTRLGAHTPLPFLPQTDLDVSGGFRLGAYPRFASLSNADATRRRDHHWDLYTAVTHYWTSRVATRASYRLINSNNRNDFFQYDRHIAGIELLFSQAF